MDWRIRSQRRPAWNESGHAHELTFTCHHRHHFFAADRTCEWLAEAIDQARRRWQFALWAYVFMPEHVHLVICPRREEYDIPSLLKAIKEPVGRRAVRYLEQNSPEWLPRITVRRGGREERRFWQAGGGYDRNVTEVTTLLAMIDYIHNNPVRRGLVAEASAWKWSSASWYERATGTFLVPDPIPPEWGTTVMPSRNS